MRDLAYKPDWHQARKRMIKWWHNEDLGRPALLITAPRNEPLEHLAPQPAPAEWQTDYSTFDLDYRIYLARKHCLHTAYLAEAVPFVRSGDVANGSLSLFQGCSAYESGGTVWQQPCITVPEETDLRYRADNFYWQFCRRVYQQVAPFSQGRFLQAFPEILSGPDCLAALRGTEPFFYDFVERPDWVHSTLETLDRVYFDYYHQLYQLVKDDTGGSVFWIWSPGQTIYLQCSWAAMLSPAMFADFVRPHLERMTAASPYSYFMLDGPAMLRHLPEILSLPALSAIQWVVGVNDPPVTDPQWYPLYHEILAAGKKLYLEVPDPSGLVALTRELGTKAQRLLLAFTAAGPDEARAYQDRLAV